MVRALLAFLAMIAVATAIPVRYAAMGSQQIKNCGSQSDPVSVTALALDPPVPELGETVDVDVTALSHESLEGSELRISVIYEGYLTLYVENKSICKYTTECPPLPEKTFDLDYHVKIPERAPSREIHDSHGSERGR
eukprot:Rmarinus@m.9140